MESPARTAAHVPGEQELYSSWALFILVSLLAGALWTSYFLQLRRITAVHETVVSILAGMLVGFVIKVSPGSTIQEMVTFNHSYFFNLLLPPIILNSGYELRKVHFFRNFGSILLFAFIGTVTSTVVIGILIWIVALTGVEGVSLSFLDSLIFGSVLSSTDPVTVLAIFSQLKVEPKLYAMIFGESMLNDAVAIVLFGTFERFRGEELHLHNVFLGIWYFFGVFFGSLIIGVVTGALVALMLKHSQLSKLPAIESCLVALTAYSTYLFSNGCQMSGIVSLLFCGISLKHYAYENMSLRTRRTTRYMFAVLAQLSENFIFIYLGITLFTKSDEVFKPFMIIVTSISIVIARFCSVFPLANIINLFTVTVLRRHQEVLNRSHQIMLFWAGLRGAVAFALAYNIEGANGPWLQTTILCVVVISVIGFGGTTSRMMKKLGIRTGVVESDYQSGSDDEEDERIRRPAGREGRLGRYVSASPHQLGASGRPEDEQSDATTTGDAVPPSFSDVQDTAASVDGGGLPLPTRFVRGKRHCDERHWFLAFDNKYIKPFLSVHSTSGERLVRWRLNSLTASSGEGAGRGSGVETPTMAGRWPLGYNDTANDQAQPSRGGHQSPRLRAMPASANISREPSAEMSARPTVAREGSLIDV